MRSSFVPGGFPAIAVIGIMLAVVGGIVAIGCSSGGGKSRSVQAAPTETALPDYSKLGSAASFPVESARLVAPPQIPAPIARKSPARVIVNLEAKEFIGPLAQGVEYKFWSFNGTVPGPAIRVREGDSVEIHLKNASTSVLPHSIDLHAVNGGLGGGADSQVAPGEEKVFTFRAVSPGAYVYHCATPLVPHHIASGMYGLIVVDPVDGWQPADREFYVMQGEFYTSGATSAQGLQEFSFEKLSAEEPEYIVFNGSSDSLVGSGKALAAKTGETIRLFFGVGGPNKVSSFHVIGEIFDVVHQEASPDALAHHVQTTLVPAGGATAVEFRVDVPGTYVLVDHSLSRLLKGAAGHLIVTGSPNDNLYDGASAKGGAVSAAH
jgi:nitrite reductase (NO-forming)